MSESLRNQLLKAGLGKAPEPKASKPKPQSQPKPKARRKSALSQTLREQAKLIIEQRRLPRGQGACAYTSSTGRRYGSFTSPRRSAMAGCRRYGARAPRAGFEVIEEKVAEKIRELDDRLVLSKPPAPGRMIQPTRTIRSPTMWTGNQGVFGTPAPRQSTFPSPEASTGPPAPR